MKAKLKTWLFIVGIICIFGVYAGASLLMVAL